MNILVATPVYGSVRPEYLKTMVGLYGHLDQRGIKWGYQTVETADIAFSRNYLATLFLKQSAFTHLLFVDSDMIFAPQSVEVLLRAGKPFVGCVYPKRNIDLQRLLAAAKKNPKGSTSVAVGMEFVVKHASKRIEVTNGLCRVQGLGMGLCLIERKVFADLAATGQLTRRVDHPFKTKAALAGPMLGFFDPIPRESGYVSEDFSFCERWTDLCGGEIWAVVNEEIGHIGTMVYRARYGDALRAKLN